MPRAHVRHATLLAAPLAALTVTVGQAAAAPPATPTTLSITAPVMEVYGHNVTISTKLTTKSGTPLAGQTVALFTRPHGTAAWSQTSTARTDSSGAASASTTFAQNTDEQWRFAGTSRYTASTSALATTYVQPVLTVARRPNQLSLGHTFVISGSLKPFHTGQAVLLQQYYSGAWHTARSVPLDANGMYRTSVKPTRTGIYTYRIGKPADSGHLAVVTGGFKTVVYFLTIAGMHFLPAGDHNLNDEYVIIRNSGSIAVNLHSWKLTEATQSLTFTLPSYALAPGASVRVHDGTGTARAGDVFLGSTKRIWSAVRDTASLYNPLSSLDMRRAW